MKRIFLCIAVLMIVASCEKDNLIPADQTPVVEKSAHQVAFPEVIPLPDGFQPEGIVIGINHTFYVGSLISGQIYKGDLRTGEGEIFIMPSEPGQTVGLSFDPRTGYLFAAKGYSGMGAVYDTKTGETIALLQLADPMTTLINDVVVTRDAAYFTSSQTPVLYKVPLMKNGQLTDPAQVIPLMLTGDFSMEPDPSVPQLGVFANGIDETENGKHLILANLDMGVIYRVDPTSGEAIKIDVGGMLLLFADGILLEGHTLYVVQNMLNQVAVVELGNDYLTGEVVEIITHPELGVPTTLDRFGSFLYLVNAHFDIAPPTGVFPDVEFEVVRIKKD